MRLLLSVLLISAATRGYAQTFQLAPPRIQYASAFFKDSMLVQMEFDQPGTAIYYTTDGTAPGTNSLPYKKSFTIRQNTVIRAIAAGKNFLSSEPVTASFIKDGLALQQVSYSRPHEVYANSATDILSDNKGGMPDFRNGQWLGYDADTATFYIQLARKQKVQQVMIDLLQDENSWIFLPAQILVRHYDDQQQQYVPAGKAVFTHDIAEIRQCVPFTIDLNTSQETDRLMITIFRLQAIPAWHPGKGNKAWFFTDEIKVY